MLNSLLLYEDWQDFFRKRLVNSGAFHLSEAYTRGDTNIEIYAALKDNLDTTIQVGYFSRTTIIYVNIFNPATPGKNRQQEIEHFYKYEFDDEKQYGPPGLDFDDINIQGISNYLEQGFHGIETIYYRNGLPAKSSLTTSYYPDGSQYTVTYHFHKQSFFRRVLNKIMGRFNEYDEVKTVNLQDIFRGLKPH